MQALHVFVMLYSFDCKMCLSGTIVCSLVFSSETYDQQCEINVHLGMSTQQTLISMGIHVISLRKHAYSDVLKISPPKEWKFSDKNSDLFHISAQNIYCGYSLELPQQGSSNEYPQSQFLSRNKKNNVYPCKPQFYYIKVGFKGVKII